MRNKIGDPFDDDNGDLDDDPYKDHEEDENGIGDEEDEDEEEDGENGRVTLDALEAEELEAVETNEPGTILVDEASEIKAIRRAEMALDMGTKGRRRDEFVCLSCFLLLKNVQLADPDNMLCVDCA